MCAEWFLAQSPRINSDITVLSKPPGSRSTSTSIALCRALLHHSTPSASGIPSCFPFSLRIHLSLIETVLLNWEMGEGVQTTHEDRAAEPQHSSPSTAALAPPSSSFSNTFISFSFPTMHFCASLIISMHEDWNNGDKATKIWKRMLQRGKQVQRQKHKGTREKVLISVAGTSCWFLHLSPTSALAVGGEEAKGSPHTECSDIRQVYSQDSCSPDCNTCSARGHLSSSFVWTWPSSTTHLQLALEKKTHIHSTNFQPQITSKPILTELITSYASHKDLPSLREIHIPPQAVVFKTRFSLQKKAPNLPACLFTPCNNRILYHQFISQAPTSDGWNPLLVEGVQLVFKLSESICRLSLLLSAFLRQDINVTWGDF